MVLGIVQPLIAGGVAEFGTVSKSKITLNPAGAAAIDRILFDVTLFNYEQENHYATLGGQTRRGSSPADIYFEAPAGSSYRYYRAEQIDYGEGDILGTRIDLGYPTRYVTVGISWDERRESFSEGRYDNDRMSAVDYDATATGNGLSCDYTRTTASFLLAIPLKGFSLGIRQNHRTVRYRIEQLQEAFLYDYEPSGVLYASSTLDPVPFDNNGTIDGQSRYQYNDYGVMLNVSDQPRLDIGYLYRPPVDAVMTFRPTTVSADGYTVYSLEDLPFTEPGLSLTSIAAGLNVGRTAFHLVVEGGDFTHADDSFQAKLQPGNSQRNRTYDVDGYLFRFTFNPYFELGYGVRSQEIAGSLTIVTSQLLKFPIPAAGTLILSMGRQMIEVLNDQDEVVAANTSYALSAEMKFGEPVTGPGRQSGTLIGRSVAPKTKTLPFYMEY
jgi:hypothetical protein